MTKKNLVIAIAVTCVLLIFWRIISNHQNKQENKVTTVSVATVKQDDIDIKTKTLGLVEAYSSLAIKSQVTGQLVTTGFKEGDTVKKGQILFQIDPRPFEIALEQAKANLTKNKATLANEQAQLKRNAKLVKQGYTSQQAYDADEAEANAIAAEVEANKAAIEDAKLELEYATIRAPIDGVAGNIALKVGSLIKANDDVLVTINQISPIYITFTLPQDRLGFLRRVLRKNKQNDVKATLSNRTSEIGKLVFIDNQVDADTGSIRLKAEFTNEDYHLWPGQHVTVELTVDFHEKIIMIPSLALMTSQDGFYVYVVKDDKAIKRDVIPGIAFNDMTVIEDGLQTGEVVVTSGQLRLSDSSKVTIQAPSQSTENKR